MDTTRDENVGESQDSTSRRGDLCTAVGEQLPSQRHLSHQQQGHYASTERPQADLWRAVVSAPSSQTRAAGTELTKHMSMTQSKETYQQSTSLPSHASGNTTMATCTLTSTAAGSGDGSHSPSHSAPATKQEPGPTNVGTHHSLQSANATSTDQEPWSQDFKQISGSSIKYERSESAPTSFPSHGISRCEGSSGVKFSSAIKLLVSNNVAGSIIGRSGQTIIELQTNSSTRIKLSQTGDYYPGTQDRVCLIQGHPENMKKGSIIILTRLFAMQQQQHHHHFPWQSEQEQFGRQSPIADSSTAPDMLGVALEDSSHAASHAVAPPTFAFVVRLLVPTSSCGMIIGKCGSNVKRMVEASGVSSVRLSPKEGVNANVGSSASAAASMISATSERVVTITGSSLERCRKCIFIILDEMALHPDICRYANMTTSYSRVLSWAHAAQAAAVAAVAQAVISGSSSTGSRSTSEPTAYYSTNTPDASMGIWDQQQDIIGGAGRPASSLRAANGFNSLQLSQSLLQDRSIGSETIIMSSDPMSPDLHARETMPPYSSPVFGTTASTAFLQTSPQNIPPNTFQRGAQRPIHSYLVPHVTAFTQSQQGLISEDNLVQTQTGSAPSSTSAPDLLTLRMQDVLRVSEVQHQSFLSSGVIDSSAAAFQSGHISSQLVAHPSTPGGFTAQIAIPDSMVGSILGRGGCTLNELMVLSDSKIRISQRGEYIPGTKNRIITICGPTTQSVTTAQFLMSQRMVAPPAILMALCQEDSPSQIMLPFHPMRAVQGESSMDPSFVPAPCAQGEQEGTVSSLKKHQDSHCQLDADGVSKAPSGVNENQSSS